MSAAEEEKQKAVELCGTYKAQALKVNKYLSAKVKSFILLSYVE